MKILESSSERLITYHKPLATWIFGGLCCAIALGRLVEISGWEPIATNLNCDRTAAQVNCQLQTKTWIGIQRQQTVEDVRSIEIRRRSNNRPIVLVTPTEKVSVSNSSSRRGTSSDIEAFLNDPTADRLSLQYVQPSQFFFLSIPVVLFAGLGFLALLVPTTTCTFDKKLNRVVLASRSPVDKQALVEEYSLSSIERIDLEAVQTKFGKSYSIKLRLKPGKERSLSCDAILITALNNYEQMAAIAQTIRDFLR